MAKVKTVGYCGNTHHKDYDDLIWEARDNGIMTYNLMTDNELTVCDDIIKCEKIYVVGDFYEIPPFARKIIAYAFIIGKSILSIGELDESFYRHCTAEFCIDMAMGLLDDGEPFNEV